MKFLYNVIYVLILFCFSCNLKAQTVKQIEVAGNAPYVDHISLIPGTTDMDLLVKISFNESSNKLTVNLISYRKLFVFQDNVRYSHAVRFRKLRPNRLPYVVESDEKARYKMMKPLRKSIKPKRKHIFKQWIEYEGLQPQPTEYKMVNDYIEQTFDILHEVADVSITLRDILVMSEQTGLEPQIQHFYQKRPLFWKRRRDTGCSNPAREHQSGIYHTRPKIRPAFQPEES